MDPQIIGYTAAALTAFASGPQAIKVIKTRQTKDISAMAYSILVSGLLLWIVYGIFKNDWPLILSNTIATLLSGTVLVLKLTENKRKAR